MKEFKCLFGITAFCVGLAMVSSGMILAAETTTAETISDEEEYYDEEGKCPGCRMIMTF